MTFTELVESIQNELDREGVKSNKIRSQISELVDLAYYAYNTCTEREQNEIRLQGEIDRLLQQLSKKERTVLKLKSKHQRDLEKIELLLYEKNEFAMLKDVIELVKCSKNKRGNSCSQSVSQISQPNPNEEAFYCSNSMTVHNTFILGQQDPKMQEIVQAINKSTITVSQKEQMVYNIIKSQTNQSQLQHVDLNEILDASYNLVSKKLNTSILSSVPLQTELFNTNKLNKQVNLQDEKLSNLLNTKSQDFTLDVLEDMESPKFHFAQLSPIKSKSVSQHKQDEVWVDSFQKQSNRKQVYIPRINLDALKMRQDNGSSVYLINDASPDSIKVIDTHVRIKEQHKKRPKHLSYGERPSFYDKSTVINAVTNINKSKDTKDTDQRRSDSTNSRARNQTFHSGQAQSQFLKELMQRMHSKKKDPISQHDKHPKVSEFEKKQLSILISKLKKK